MIRKTALWCAAATIAGASCAVAIEAPKLPASARKLTGAQIETLYGDTAIVGMNYDDRELLMFSAKVTSATRSFVVHVFTATRHAGSFNMTYRIEGDLWCYKPQAGGEETCVGVHQDGEVVYETGRDGKVSARNMVWR